MKCTTRSMSFVGAVAAAVVTAAICAAGVAAAAVPASGMVVGAGSVSTYDFAVIVEARGGPDGASGELSMRSAGTLYRASVDCVLVYGNSALVVGTLRHPQGTFTKLIAEFVDNGNGPNSPPDDVVAALAMPGPGPDDCHPTLVDFSDAFPVDHGNFIVRPG